MVGEGGGWCGVVVVVEGEGVGGWVVVVEVVGGCGCGGVWGGCGGMGARCARHEACTYMYLILVPSARLAIHSHVGMSDRRVCTRGPSDRRVGQCLNE